MNTLYFRTKINFPSSTIHPSSCLVFPMKGEKEIPSWPCKWSFSFLKHEIWLPLQSGLTLTACTVNNSSFLSHSVWLYDLPQKWIPGTDGALENGDGSSLILDVQSIELGASCFEFSINANLAGSQRRYPNSLGKHLPYKTVLKNPRVDSRCSFLSLPGLEEMENILPVSVAGGKQAILVNY